LFFSLLLNYLERLDWPSEESTWINKMSGINQKVFGKLDDGKDVNLFELVNKNGMKVEVRN